MKNNKYYTPEIEEYQVVFQETIKNKSELKRLLKQLGI